MAALPCFSGSLCSGKQHRIAIAEKAVLLFDGVAVGGADVFDAGKGAHQHQQSGFGQMEVGNQAIGYLKTVARGDENIGITLACLQMAVLGGGFQATH